MRITIFADGSGVVEYEDGRPPAMFHHLSKRAKEYFEEPGTYEVPESEEAFFPVVLDYVLNPFALGRREREVKRKGGDHRYHVMIDDDHLQAFRPEEAHLVNYEEAARIGIEAIEDHAAKHITVSEWPTGATAWKLVVTWRDGEQFVYNREGYEYKYIADAIRSCLGRTVPGEPDHTIRLLPKEEDLDKPEASGDDGDLSQLDEADE